MKQVEEEARMNLQPIRMTATVHSHIISHCLQTEPHEACGFLFGTIAQQEIIIRNYTPVPNVALEPTRRFEMNPTDMIAFMYKKDESHPDLIGILHSHPFAGATPSHEDLLTAWHHLPSHWIVSLRNKEAPDMQAFRYVPHGNNGNHYIPLHWSIVSG